MKLTGTYRFYENGELVGEQSNLITTAGKATVVRYFAGSVQTLCKSIAVGIYDAAANVADYHLGYEVARADVNNIGADLVNNKVIFKATLPAEVVANIREVGGFTQSVNPDAGAYISKNIFFMDASEQWSPANFSVANTRVGQSLLLTAAASATTPADLTNANFDISGYQSTDTFLLAMYVGDANAASVTVKLGSDSSNYLSWTINNPAAGYQIASFTKGSGAITGTPDLANVDYIHIDVTAKAAGTTNVYIDSLRVEDSDTSSQTYCLFSHSILATPIQKKSGIPMEVEYSIGITV